MTILAKYKVVFLSHFKQSNHKLHANQWGIPILFVGSNSPVCCFLDPYFNESLPLILFLFLQVALILFLLLGIKNKNKIQKLLKASEHRYRYLFNNLSEAFGLYEVLYNEDKQAVDYIIRDLNPRLLEIYNVSYQAVINKRGSAVFHYCANKWKDLFLDIAVNGGVKKHVEYVEELDKYFELKAFSPEKNFFAVIYIDITENEKSKAALRIQKSRTEDILKGTNAGTWEWNIPAASFTLSERWAQIIGYTLEEIQPTNEANVFNFVAPEDWNRVNGIVDRVMSQELGYMDLEFRQKHKNGYYVWVHSRGSVVEWDAEGKPLKMLGTSLDISVKKEISIALNESEKRFKAIFRNSNAVMFIVDPQTTEIVDVNNTAARFYGYSREGLLGMRMDEINVLSQEEIAHEMNRARLENKSVFSFKHRLASGRIRYVNVIASPIYVNGKEFLHSIVIDTTSAVETKYKIKQINKRFEAINHIIHYRASSINDLLDFTLKESIEFTNSDFGAIYHFDGENEIFCLNNWSQNVKLTHPYSGNTLGLDNMDCLSKAVKSKAVIIENEPTQYYPFQKLDNSKVELLKSITLPVLVNNDVVALFWMATKDNTYSKFHAGQLMLLLDTAWIMVEKHRMKG